MMAQLSNQTIFSNLKQPFSNETTRIIEKNLQKQSYDPIYAAQLIQKICSSIIQKVTSINKNFKFITNCVLLPKGGNGLDMSGLCAWDPEMDGSLTVKWENQGIVCIVNLYGVAV